MATKLSNTLITITCNGVLQWLLSLPLLLTFALATFCYCNRKLVEAIEGGDFFSQLLLFQAKEAKAATVALASLAFFLIFIQIRIKTRAKVKLI